MSDDASGSVICTHEVSLRSHCGCVSTPNLGADVQTPPHPNAPKRKTVDRVYDLRNQYAIGFVINS